MQKALRNGKQLRFFADLWLSVLNDTVDSQADFNASVLQSNMDFTTLPGEARLSKNPDFNTPVITQDTGTSTIPTFKPCPEGVGPHSTTLVALWQGFKINNGGIFKSITLKVENPSSSEARNIYCAIHRHNWTADPSGTFPETGMTVQDFVVDPNIPNPYQLIATRSESLDAGYSDEITFDFSELDLTPDTYWIKVYTDVNITDSPLIYYDPGDKYADGALYKVEETIAIIHSGPVFFSVLLVRTSTSLGDAYFKVNIEGYTPAGSVTTKTLDLGEAPAEDGVFQMSYSQPAGTQLAATLYGSSTGAFSGEETVITGASDGASVPPFRYWRVRLDLGSDSLLSKTPSLDMIEFLYPKKLIRLREKEVALLHIAEDIQRDYRALMKPLSFGLSELKVIERIASGGTISITIEDSGPDIIQWIVSDSPLKNHRASLYLGADVSGFSRDDLLRFFVGMVERADVKPKFCKDVFALDLTIKNPILELKRKAPMSAQTGQLDLDAGSINHDGLHVVDSMIDIIRGKANIPARYINLESFSNARPLLGYGNVASPALVVRRSDAPGLPDTRIKSPEEVVKLLTPLAVIADGYIVEDESSRITFVQHNVHAAAEAVWADEQLVRDGLDAVPMQDVGMISLGYADLLFNLCYCGCDWDGSGSDWKAFSQVFAYIDADSADDWAQGVAQYVQVMEKNMIEVSKWLGPGPEAGHKSDGAALAQAIAERMVKRFAYPPARLQGVVVPVSEFMRTLGSVVQIHSKEFCKFRRREIALSEIVKFIVISKKYDQGRNRMIFDLLELT